MVAYIKKKDFKETCVFQEWRELPVGFGGLPKLLWKDIKGEEQPGIVVCLLKEKAKARQKNCIRKKCPFYLTIKKLEQVNLKLDKLKNQINSLNKLKNQIDSIGCKESRHRVE